MRYEDFLASKEISDPDTGLSDIPSINPMLFDFQKDIVSFALRRGRAAIFAGCGLGKGPIQMEWADKQPYECIIAAPLAVAQQFVREAEKFGIELSYAKNQSEVKNRITVTNYERLDAFHLEQFGAVSLDECFPFDTEIDTTSGPKKISDIRVGDEIFNASGIDVVHDVHRREIKYAVKIKHQGKYFIASPNHPIFTQRGWVGAQDLQPGDYALETKSAMHMVRERIFAPIPINERSAILRDILLSEMADEPAGTFSESAYTRSSSEARSQEIGMAQFGRSESETANGTDTKYEPDEQSRIESEMLPPIERDEAQTFRAWGKRTWFDCATKDHVGCVVRELDTGICFATGATGTKLSDALQARLSERRKENSNRGGWKLTSEPEAIGREKGCESGFVRLDGIEVLESGHPELEKFRDADGKLYFFDLGATRHPSFSVNGLLVHNSSILKSYDGKTRTWLIEAFKQTPFRLCSSATPAPNDYMELGNHAEFLGVMNRTEMLATFFCHDGGDTSKWRLKGHAERDFWRWLCSWAVMIRQPSDLGYEDGDFILPDIIMHQITVKVDKPSDGYLFPMEATSLQERLKARRDTIEERVSDCAKIVNATDEQFLVWCNLNDESEAIAKAVDGAVEVKGSDNEKHKECSMVDFANGDINRLVSKPSICGYGMNFQNCNNVAFVGLSDSFEDYYQAVRRCYRFGQKKPVNVYIITSETEGAVVANIKRKEAQAKKMADEMVKHMSEMMRAKLRGAVRGKIPYQPQQNMRLPEWIAA